MRKYVSWVHLFWHARPFTDNPKYLYSPYEFGEYYFSQLHDKNQRQE